MRRSAALSVLLKHWDGRLPVSPAAVAVSAGLVVRAADDLGDLCGRLYASSGGSPVIVYAAGEPEVRQRFAIAHLLGHHILSPGKPFSDPVAHFSEHALSADERKANTFAVELLMPKALCDRQIRDGVRDVSVLAGRFGLAERAVVYGLSLYGWIR